MRSAFAIGLALSLLAVSAAASTPSKPKSHGNALSGTVLAVDHPAKTFVVREASGRQTTLLVTAATHVKGEGLKPGARVAVRWLAKDGKKIATSVRVEPPALASATPTASAPGSR
jgi:hypothetical protein